MSSRTRRAAAACFGGLVIVLWAGILWAADPKPADTGSKDPKAPEAKATDEKTPDKPEGEASGPEKLSLEQKRIADQFKHLEGVLLKMAEHTAAVDPRRAALLRKAVEQSKEQSLDLYFERVTELLKQDRLGDAVENQTLLDQELRSLLELLMSEDRSRKLEAEKGRYRRYLNEVNKLIKEQKREQGRAAGGEDPKGLAPEEGKLADKLNPFVADKLKAKAYRVVDDLRV